MRIGFLFASLLLSSAFVLSCSGKKTEEVIIASEPGLSEKVTGSPLYVIVSTNYEGATTKTVQGGCYFETTDSAPMGKSCTVRIPELTLHYSDLSFTLGSDDAVTCAQVAFSPYFYRRSTANNFLAPGDSATTDCTAGDEAKCWGGAAVTMVAGFPKVTGSYFLPAITASQTFTLKASNTLKLASTSDVNLRGNINSCNNLPIASRTAAIATPVVYDGADDYYDYEIYCRDKWGATKYMITLTIADYDTVDSAADVSSDHYYDWGY